MSPRAAAAYEFGPFRLDPREQALLLNGQPVPLTPKAFDVLLCLVEHHGHLVTKEDLLAAVWPGAFVEEAVLSVNMSAIRRALGDDRNGHTYIETVPRRGYRFIAAVSRIDAQPEVTGADEPEMIAAQAPVGALANVKRSRALTIGMTLAAAVLIGSAGLLVSRYLAGPAVASSSIAVLPLQSISKDAEQEQFASAMTEMLITSLGRIPALRVASRQSILQYGGSRKALAPIARELKVAYIVEGTVARDGDRVRITAQLIDGTTDRHVWARSYERDLRGTFALQNDVAESIAREIGVTVSGMPPKRPLDEHIPADAYEAYLRGNYLLDAGNAPAAIAEFRKAVATAPAFAVAHARIAMAFFEIAYFGSAPPKEAYPGMKEAALKAVELDGTLAEAHAALALVKMHYDWDWASAKREFLRSLELNPSDSYVRHLYAHFLLTMGEPADSLEEMDRAFDIDPVGITTAT